MLKHTISELKEAVVCLKAGQVTLNYPFEPHPPEENFRGKPVVDGVRCIGCGACANICPPRLINLKDADGYRQITFELGRCTYCANCRDVCPEKAITMSSQSETSTSSIDDLLISLKLKLVKCRSCGEVVTTQRIVDKVKYKLNEEQHNQTDNLNLCISCKRRSALKSPVFYRDVLASKEVG